MIEICDIIDALRREIHAAFPKPKQYINLCPDKFTRPAFLIEYVTTTARDASFGCLDVTQYFTITCFLQVGELHETDTKGILSMQEGVIKLFRKGYLRVKDRAIKVSASTGGRNWDEAYIDIQFQYQDERGIEEEREPMGEVSTTIKGE